MKKTIRKSKKILVRIKYFSYLPFHFFFIILLNTDSYSPHSIFDDNQHFQTIFVNCFNYIEIADN